MWQNGYNLWRPATSYSRYVHGMKVGEKEERKVCKWRKIKIREIIHKKMGSIWVSFTEWDKEYDGGIVER